MYHMVIEVIPIVFGHAGVVSTNCMEYLTKIPGYCESLLQVYKRLLSLEQFTIYDQYK